MVLSCIQANLSSLLNPVLHPPVLRVALEALFSGCMHFYCLSLYWRRWSSLCVKEEEEEEEEEAVADCEGNHWKTINKRQRKRCTVSQTREFCAYHFDSLLFCEKLQTKYIVPWSLHTSSSSSSSSQWKKKKKNHQFSKLHSFVIATSKRRKKIVAVKKNIAPELQNHLTPYTKMENSQNGEEEN